MKPTPSHAPVFKTTVLPAIVGALFVVATMAFIGIPWSLGGHPGETAAVAATTPTYHPS